MPKKRSPCPYPPLPVLKNQAKLLARSGSATELRSRFSCSRVNLLALELELWRALPLRILDLAAQPQQDVIAACELNGANSEQLGSLYVLDPIIQEERLFRRRVQPFQAVLVRHRFRLHCANLIGERNVIELTQSLCAGFESFAQVARHIRQQGNALARGAELVDPIPHHT